MKKKKTSVFKIMMTTIACSSIISSNAYAACSLPFYAQRVCANCDYSYSSSVDTCTARHKRQYGIKFCAKDKNYISEDAEFYKRGYSDYNCLAYAIGKNGAGSWEWPTDWGNAGPTREQFIEYIIDKGYSYANQASIAQGKKVFYVYEKNGRIQHFARKYTLDGKTLDGYKTISKWGRGALYKTTSLNPYKETSNYGTMVLVCYK